MHINFRSTHTLQYTNRLFVFPPVPPHRETYIPFLFSEYTYAWKIFFCSCYNRSEHFWQLNHHSRLARSSIQQRLSCPEILLTHIMPYLETKASVLFLTALGFFPRTPLTAIHTVAFKKKNFTFKEVWKGKNVGCFVCFCVSTGVTIGHLYLLRKLVLNSEKAITSAPKRWNYEFQFKQIPFQSVFHYLKLSVYFFVSEHKQFQCFLHRSNFEKKTTRVSKTQK